MAENKSSGTSKVKAVASAIKTSLLGKGPQKTRVPRPKLLVSVVNRGEGGRLREILGDITVPLNFSFVGEGTARTHLLDYLGIGSTEKTVIFTLFPEQDEGAVIRELRTQMSLYLAGRGISFTVPLAGVSEIVAKGLTSSGNTAKTSEVKVMTAQDRKYHLIVVAVNANHVDEAMDAAREAGASGGTIIRARSADNVKAEQFIGISLMQEQELLLVLAKKENAGAIMETLSEKVGLKTPAGGIIFALPVDRTAGIAAEGEIEEEKPHAD